jgi:hypothetical protein
MEQRRSVAEQCLRVFASRHGVRLVPEIGDQLPSDAQCAADVAAVEQARRLLT